MPKPYNDSAYPHFPFWRLLLIGLPLVILFALGLEEGLRYLEGRNGFFFHR